MERRIIHIHGQPGCGKTSALLSLINSANEAGSRRSVFISFNFDAVIDGRQRLLAMLDGLDKLTTASVWHDSGAPVPLLMGPGLSREFIPVFVPAFDLPAQLVSQAQTYEQPMRLARLRSLIRSALRQIDRLISLLLSLAGQRDYPVSEFLIELQWFLLHGTHPPPANRQ